MDAVQVDEGWWEAVELQKLILAHNNIRLLNEELGNLSSLAVLNVCHNKLSELPAAIGELPALMRILEQIGSVISLVKIRSEDVATVLSLGEQGGTGGDKWDDGVFSSIKQVDIIHDGRYINSIYTEYCDDNGNSNFSDKHGGNSEDGTLEKVVLEYPDEYLVSIHGYMGDDDGYDEHYVIRSLTFVSNKRSLGPFGWEYGTRFWFPTTGLVKVVGFHGKAGWFLDSIGIKVVPIHNNTVISSVEQ